MIEKLAARRTQYVIGRDVKMGQDEIDKLIRSAISYSPSAFNPQSSRAVIIFGDHHQRLWEMVKVKSPLNPDNFPVWSEHSTGMAQKERFHTFG